MDEANTPPEGVAQRRVKQVFVLFAIIAGFFLIAEHRAHVVPYLPWLILAACPLMHMFMHHGHGGHHHGGGESPDGRNGERSGSVNNLPVSNPQHHRGSPP